VSVFSRFLKIAKVSELTTLGNWCTAGWLQYNTIHNKIIKKLI